MAKMKTLLQNMKSINANKNFNHNITTCTQVITGSNHSKQLQIATNHSELKTEEIIKMTMEMNMEETTTEMLIL